MERMIRSCLIQVKESISTGRFALAWIAAKFLPLSSRFSLHARKQSLMPAHRHPSICMALWQPVWSGEQPPTLTSSPWACRLRRGFSRAAIERALRGLSRGVEIGAASPADFHGQGDEVYGLRVFLRRYCVHLVGPDSTLDVPAFPADRRAARGFNGDLAQHRRRCGDALRT